MTREQFDRKQLNKNHQQQKKGMNMSTVKPTTPAKTANKPAPTPPPAKNGSAKDEKPAKAKRPRVRWVSPKDPKFWVRSYKDVTDQYGAPLDPWGNKMEARVAAAFGMTDEQREARKAAKEAEKKRIEAMSPEEKLAWTQAKREERAKTREAKKAKEREALIAQIKREIEEGKHG